MAYSRFTLNKKEKTTIGVLLLLAMVHFLTQTFPALKSQLDKLWGANADMVNNALENVGLVAIGFTIVKVSRALVGVYRLSGMVLGYGVILVAVVPYLFRGRSLQSLLGGGE